MRAARIAAVAFLIVVYVSSLGASWLSPTGFGTQYRDAILAAPCHQFPFGTDDLGRDLFSRLLYGSRTSLLLAPASGLVATFIALLVGGAAGWIGGVVAVALHRVIDLFLSVPWLFLLLIVRAMLPLNLSSTASVLATFLVLGCFGWAASARVVSESVSAIRRADYVAHARALGVSPICTLLRHVLPNLRSIAVAQFWICVPVFIVAEANLGFLGLGVGEPLPSWGNLLRQLENYERVESHPWLLAPLCLIVLVLASFQLCTSARRTPS